MDRIIEKSDLGWWIVSHEQKLWLPGGEIPYGAADIFDLVGQPALRIGEWQGDPVWLIQQARRQDMGSVRQVLDLDVGLFQLAGRGVQLAEFYRSHKYCGYCGHTMHPSKTEWAMLCGHCRERYYPQIAPCIIVAIRRDDSILLAQHTRHRNGIHTVLAGFVEVGETLEQAVAREVMEESGIKVKNLRDVPDDRVYGGIRQRRDCYRSERAAGGELVSLRRFTATAPAGNGGASPDRRYRGNVSGRV